MPRVRTAMTIAGSDSSGGAGVQADLKTFAAFGTYGTSVIAAVTAQNTLGVTAAFDMPPGLVAAQIDAIMGDIGANAVKTGMLSNALIIQVVAEKAKQYRFPSLVMDPVMAASMGNQRLLQEEAVSALRDRLIPLATVITPNTDEAAALVGRTLSTADDIRQAARELRDMGAQYVVITGGHLPGPEVVDLLYDGKDFREYVAPRIDTPNTHGTGCTFASAIAASLAQGQTVEDAVARAKEYLTEALRRSYYVGKGRGPVHHFWRFWKDGEQ